MRRLITLLITLLITFGVPYFQLNGMIKTTKAGSS